mgnify:CR=1 FL=1
MTDVKEVIPDYSDIPSMARLPTTFGDFMIRVFHEEETGFDHVALTLGDMEGPDPVLIRVHSECLTGDAFGSLRCDCGPQLHAALDAIKHKGWGCLLYLRQEGRGIGLFAKVQAYHLQDLGYDTLDANLALGLPADARTYEMAASMLQELGVRRVRLMTNNPLKRKGLSEHGIDVEDRIQHLAGLGKHNIRYLETKAERMGHLLSTQEV